MRARILRPNNPLQQKIQNFSKKIEKYSTTKHCDSDDSTNNPIFSLKLTSLLENIDCRIKKLDTEQTDALIVSLCELYLVLEKAYLNVYKMDILKKFLRSHYHTISKLKTKISFKDFLSVINTLSSTREAINYKPSTSWHKAVAQFLCKNLHWLRSKQAASQKSKNDLNFALVRIENHVKEELNLPSSQLRIKELNSLKKMIQAIRTTLICPKDCVDVATLLERLPHDLARHSLSYYALSPLHDNAPQPEEVARWALELALKENPEEGALPDKKAYQFILEYINNHKPILNDFSIDEIEKIIDKISYIRIDFNKPPFDQLSNDQIRNLLTKSKQAEMVCLYNCPLNELPETLLKQAKQIILSGEIMTLPEGLIARSVRLYNLPMTTLPKNLPEVRDLRLRRMFNLRSLPSHLNKLTDLYMWECPNVTTLPTMKQAKCVTTWDGNDALRYVTSALPRSCQYRGPELTVSPTSPNSLGSSEQDTES